MAVINKTFETIEGIAKASGKSAAQGVADLKKDATQALTGNYSEPGTNENQSGGQQISSQQKTQIRTDDSQKANQIRQNIAAINAQIKEIRKGRQQQEQQTLRQAEGKQQEKKFEVKKKESLLAKLIKSRKGTKEGMQRVSG